MSYKTNLEEKQELRDYRKFERRFFAVFFVVLSLVVVFFVGKFVGSSLEGEDYWFRVPFYSSRTRNLDILLLVFLSLFYFWNKGTKRKILANMFKKIPFFGKTLIRGKVAELEDFFYPQVTFTDGVKRAKKPYYFKSKNHHLGNLFDFGKYSSNQGTDKFVSLFRDSKREELKKESLSLRGKRAQRAKEALEFCNKELEHKPSERQERLYTDLFMMLEGIYNSYANDYGDKINIDSKMKNPLTLYTKKGTKRIVSIEVDESIDVFRNGKVYFSIDMIMETVASLTRLYVMFLEKRLQSGRFLSISKSTLERNEMFFKFFMLRHILLNYSNIPSGWICVKVEDYTVRAIASNIDRPMLIDINEKNNGTTSSYHSDVEANQFLFTYWAFMAEKKIKKTMSSIDFIYEASKEIKELRAREIAREAMQDIEKERKETYDSIEDKDLVILPPKEKEA